MEGLFFGILRYARPSEGNPGIGMLVTVTDVSTICAVAMQ